MIQATKYLQGCKDQVEEGFQWNGYTDSEISKAVEIAYCEG